MARTTKSKICPDCKGKGKKGAQLCRACNPSSALGDIAAGAARRAANRLNGRAIRLTDLGTASTSRGSRTIRASDGLPSGGSGYVCSCGATTWLNVNSRGKTSCLPGHGCNPRR
ncbi:hypothetical protein CC117_00720 [Parafrankia colletiae]|uniref:Uncharacterized protein n=1 Tax=Parafrankia colletiae TaxID=573497 RepID=A0A1S1RLQ8_9ACTN|nr:hypothetical protein [Parafrankia colletiae]MCK9904282.1 hypothetical protein [Frankia sp. Cpl3]OHV46212.1 hypothetical protein CC117_00720 [Parafrankia colletiae]